MKRTFFLISFIVIILILPISVYAVEGMSSEEIAIREKLDKAKKKLYECFAENEVDPRKIDKSVCRDEQDEENLLAKIFNKFMKDKRAKRAKVPLKVRMEEFNKFGEKYSTFTEDRLRMLHKENCQTKWGSSSSSECQAIASQLQKKKMERLRSEEKSQNNTRAE